MLNIRILEREAARFSRLQKNREINDQRKYILAKYKHEKFNTHIEK